MNHNKYGRASSGFNLRITQYGSMSKRMWCLEHKEGCKIAWGTSVTEIQFSAPGSAALSFQASHKLHSNGCETTNDHYCSQLNMRIKKEKEKKPDGARPHYSGEAVAQEVRLAAPVCMPEFPWTRYWVLGFSHHWSVNVRKHLDIEKSAWVNEACWIKWFGFSTTVEQLYIRTSPFSDSMKESPVWARLCWDFSLYFHENYFSKPKQKIPVLKRPRVRMDAASCSLECDTWLTHLLLFSYHPPAVFKDQFIYWYFATVLQQCKR